MSEMKNAVMTSIARTHGLEDIGPNEYLVHSDKYFDDGDELHIVLKITDDDIVITDEGHTMMCLSYEDFKFTPTRESMFRKIISQNCVRYEDGRIMTSVRHADGVGSALSSLEQAIIQTADLRRLSRNNVASTFIEDIRAAYLNSALKDRCEFKRRIQSGMDSIEPDVYIDGSIPVLVFGVHNSEKAKETFINLMFARNSDGMYRTIVVIDDNAEISRKDHKRLINAADRPVEGIEEMVSLTMDMVDA